MATETDQGDFLPCHAFSLDLTKLGESWYCVNYIVFKIYYSV